MTDHGTQRSTVRPDDIEITETKVFAASDVTAVEEDGEEGFSGYEFGLKEYTKDEYIQLQAESIAQQSDEITELQEALCDLYESLG